MSRHAPVAGVLWTAAVVAQADAGLWTDSQLAAIHKMLHPRSVAVIGATPRLQYGGRLLKAILRAKDRVNVYPVNPKYDELGGVKCYASIEDLPESPDLAGIVVPYPQVLDVLQACHRKGVGSAIVISAGFAERGTPEGRALQDRLEAFAQESGLRISGPNCLGVANVIDDIWPMAMSSVVTVPDAPGAIGLVCQSGATAFGPLRTRAADAGIGYSYIISTGNEADLEFADYARYLLDDPATRVIAGFIEGFKTAEKFIALAKLAAERGKPLVLIKIGRSEAGALAAGSHTGALTGSDARFDAVFAQYGVIRVQDYDELLEVSQLLAQSPRPEPAGIAVVSHSGGVSSLTADMLGNAGLSLPPLNDAVRDDLNGIIQDFGWAANPADLTGFLHTDAFPHILESMTNQPAVGTLVIASGGTEDRAEQVLQLRKRTGKVLVYLWTGTRTDSRGLTTLKSGGVPIFYSPVALARGLKSQHDYYAWRDKRIAHGFATAPSPTPAQSEAKAWLGSPGRSVLSEFDSKRLIAAWGVTSTREERAGSAEEAEAAAERLGYPVVLKADTPDILHKTEAGVVHLGLKNARQIRTAYAELNSRAGRGVLVQEMVTDALEVIIGVAYDEQLGPILLFGSGGVLVEVYQDVALRRCPIAYDEALDMIAEVKGARMLRGFRGRPPADVAALAHTLVDVSHLAVHLEGVLAELDINPLMVLPAGRGVKAADALVILKGNRR
jgi:acyl-CoA synthetase (NDP forming)